jgi:hypothetical protein
VVLEPNNSTRTITLQCTCCMPVLLKQGSGIELHMRCRAHLALHAAHCVDVAIEMLDIVRALAQEHEAVRHTVCKVVKAREQEL